MNFYHRHPWFIHVSALSAVLAFSTAPSCLADLLRAPLEEAQMTNGAETLAPLTPLEERLLSHTGVLRNTEEKPLASITWVHPEGYFITKASEVPHLEKYTLEWGPEKERKRSSVREIRRDPNHDVVLAQAVDARGVKAVQFKSSKELTFGQWIAAPSAGKSLKVGVVSAQRRSIRGLGAAIGIRMADSRTPSDSGVRIIGVAEDSPAASAGLRTNDVMLELAGERVSEYRRVNEIISTRQPGEEIAIKLKRGSQEKTLHVRLASRTKVLANWDGEDFANGGISIRTDNFSEVLQHDMPLHPADMGSPVLDLEGQAVAINIARVDRVTTFALPGEVFWPMVEKWLQADLRPPKAEPAQTRLTSTPGKNDAAGGIVGPKAEPVKKAAAEMP